MLYKSTRSADKNLTFVRDADKLVDSVRAVLTGLAPDGGLFMPVSMDKPFNYRGLLGDDFETMAEKIFAYYLDDYTDLHDIVRRAYSGKFDTPEITPLVKVGGKYVLELFHGPTSAFKDVALSALPVLMSEAIKSEGDGRRILILTATSGDTGKAAMEGFKDVPGISIMVFYPDGGVSPIQQCQMTCAGGANVYAAAIKGNFDDAQSAVKSIFSRVAEAGDEDMPASYGFALSSANSINIGRLVPQIVYYFKAYAELVKSGEITDGEPVDYTVPTGNFGDILAGYLAKLMGLPVGRLICASNANNVLTDFISTGTYNKNREFFKTESPSMDILVSSNLERLLYLLYDCDAEAVAGLMSSLAVDGKYSVSAPVLARLQKDFACGCADDAQTLATVRKVFEEHNYLLDTHTAVAWSVAEQYAAREGGSRKMVVLSTASPYKFPAAVLGALGGICPEDPFELIEALEKKSGVPAPKNLTALKDAEPRFRDVIGRDEIWDCVMNYIKSAE